MLHDPAHRGEDGVEAGNEQQIDQPELFGITLPAIPNRPYFVTVESRTPLDLATAARLAETAVEEILALNAHIRAVTEGYAEKGYLAVAPSTFHRVKQGVEIGYTPDDIAPDFFRRGVDDDGGFY